MKNFFFSVMALVLCFVFCLYLYTSLSPLSLSHSFTHAFTQQTFRDGLCAFLLGDTGTTESHKNQWPPPLSEPAFLSLPSFPAKLIHGNLLTVCPHGLWSFGSLETSMLGNPVVSWSSPYSAFRQPSTWPAPSSFMHFWFPSHFLPLSYE